MKIYSKKAFQFDHPAGEEPAVLVRHEAFAVVPDWVEESSMFKLAKSEGSVMVVESKQDEAAAEAAAEAGGGRGNRRNQGAGDGTNTATGDGTVTQ